MGGGVLPPPILLLTSQIGVRMDRQSTEPDPGEDRGPVCRDAKGFTLIELLIVVVIIGILAAIAIPKFANTKGKAVAAGMKSDLRNLASAQEAYWVEFRTYYGGAIPNAAFTYQPDPGSDRW